MTAVVEGLYIFTADSYSSILSHIYTSRPPSPADLAARLRTSSSPPPAIHYLADLQPATTVHSVSHAGLVLCVTSSRDGNSLAFVTFLQRVVDILEDFLGSPLLASNIESSYSVVAQLLTEICDGGIICNTEANALHDQVEISSGLVNKLLHQVGLPQAAVAAAAAAPTGLGSASSLSSLSSSTAPGLTALRSSSPASSLTASTSAVAIPWRRPNVRHTSNEVYVDMVESLSLLLAPSGRPIRYLARGTILCTCKISGVPDLLLTLSALGGTSSDRALGIQRAMAVPSFHPCVRLNRWKESPGELSFIPPDGKFVLASYETDLLASDLNQDEVVPSKHEKVFVPASVDLRTGLGAKGNEFEAKLRLDTKFGRTGSGGGGYANSRASSAGPFGGGGGGSSSGGRGGSGGSSTPVLDGVVVHIPFGDNVRTVTELNASRGEAHWTSKAGSRQVEWKVSTSGKDGSSVSGTAVLTGTVIGLPGINADDAPAEINGGIAGAGAAADGQDNDVDVDRRAMSEYYYDSSNNSNNNNNRQPSTAGRRNGSGNGKTKSSSSLLMPRSISVSFSVRGWLASGVRVDSLTVDAARSRGLGEGVRPYKGVKYVSVSRRGVERRV